MNTKDWIKKHLYLGNWFEDVDDDDDDYVDDLTQNLLFQTIVPQFISIFNFHVLNTRSSSIAAYRTAKVYQSDVQLLLNNIHNCLLLYLEDEEAFVKHCQEMEKVLGHKADQKGFLVSFAFKVALEFNLPIPLCQSWVENDLFDYHYYCENIFWPKVRSEFMRREATQGENVIKVMKSVMIKHKDTFLKECNKALVGQVIETSYNRASYKINSVGYDMNPKTELVISKVFLIIEIGTYLKLVKN